MDKPTRTPEELRAIRVEAAKKAAQTRKAREATLAPEAREALRAKRAAQLAKNISARKPAITKQPKPTRTPEELRLIRVEAARKAAQTRKAREAALEPEAREALRAKRAAQLAKNITKATTPQHITPAAKKALADEKRTRKKERKAQKGKAQTYFKQLKSALSSRTKMFSGLSNDFLKIVTMIIKQTKISPEEAYKYRDKIDYAIKLGQYPTKDKDREEALKTLQDIFIAEKPPEFNIGYQVYSRILDMFAGLPEYYTWNGELLRAQYEFHQQYGLQLISLLNDKISSEGFTAVLQRLSENAEHYERLADIIFYDSDSSNVSSALTEFAILLKGEPLTVTEAMSLHDSMEEEEDWDY